MAMTAEAWGFEIRRALDTSARARATAAGGAGRGGR